MASIRTCGRRTCVRHTLPASDEAQSQLRQEQVLDTLRVLRIGADDGGKAPGGGSGMEPLGMGAARP